MASVGILHFSVASVVENVLQQHGQSLCDIDLASRKANEDSIKRYEATGWLRKMVGVVLAKDLPAQPSEEEFRLGLRSGVILCTVLNKIQSGAVPKIVEVPSDPDGAAKSTSQYMENVKNFLLAMEEIGIPTFEASDLEKGGNSSRIVDSVLALKSYSEWKQRGGLGSWKFSGDLNSGLPPSGKTISRKNSEPLTHSLSKSFSTKSLDSLSLEDLGQNQNETGSSRPLHVLVRELLLDKKKEEVPIIVENMLNKVTEEFEHRLAAQNEQLIINLKELDVSGTDEYVSSPASGEMQKEDTETSELEKDSNDDVKNTESNEKDARYAVKGRNDDGNSAHSLKQRMLVEQQHKDLQILRHTLSIAREDLQHLRMNYQEEVNCLGQHLHSLAHAASGYQKVLEENRKLYNLVQDLKGSIRVYCRVRPFLTGKQNHLSTVANIDAGRITIITPTKNGKEGQKSFTFNQVYGPSATQEEVFSDMKPLICSVLDGYNVCIFAYGQTGSGKTYTMSGPHDLKEETLGVNYRALGDLFLISEQRKNTISYEVFVQMIEIYNEQVRDLLVADGLNKKLEIRNSSHKGLNVPDANLVPVTSTSDVINLMNIGQRNRAVGSTAMNDRSSRSHSCLTVHVQGKDLTSGAGLCGCMHLVDLAGSERADKTEAVGERLKEAQHINKSLSALGDVISSLAQKNAHVPYRNSKLTQLLQDSLGGQAKTLMFVHISPESDAIGETISTLKFAERVSTVELGTAKANKDGGDVKELKEQIAKLKAALAKKEAENLQQSKLVRMMSAGASFSSLSWQDAGNSGNSRQPTEDLGDGKDKSNSKPKQRRQSLEPEDTLKSSPSLQPPSTGSQLNGRAGSGKWVDKLKLSKQNSLSKNGTPVGKQCNGDNKQLPESFYQKRSPDPKKVYTEQPDNFSVNKLGSLDNKLNKSKCESATPTDESDDFDAATSDSSELDFSKGTSTPNVTGSKLKRPSPRQAKSPEIRSSIPQPSPRRLSGVGATVPKTGKQPVSVDVKRKAGNAK